MRCLEPNKSDADEPSVQVNPIRVNFFLDFILSMSQVRNSEELYAAVGPHLRLMLDFDCCFLVVGDLNVRPLERVYLSTRDQPRGEFLEDIRPYEPMLTKALQNVGERGPFLTSLLTAADKILGAIVLTRSSSFGLADDRFAGAISSFLVTLLEKFIVHEQLIDEKIKLEIQEVELREKAYRLKMAIEVSKVGFYDWDIANDHIVMSQQMRRDWGFGVNARLEDALGYISEDDRDRVRQQIEQAITDRTPYKAQYRLIRPDGRIAWIEAQGQALYDEAGSPVRFIGTSLDITEDKQSALELEAAKNEAEAARDQAQIASQTKSAFLANMSHEIRTPLAVIIGYADLLREETGNRQESLRFIDAISRNAKGLTRIIDDILDLSKVEAGRLSIEFAPMNLKETIYDTLSFFQDRARTKGLQLTTEIDPGFPEWIHSDSTRLRQILLNIVGNAVKFTEKGFVRVHARATLLQGTRYAFAIEVKDSGRGLSPEQQEKLFQPFTQADNSTAREFGGTGLGLVLSRKLAQALGGNVTITACGMNQGCSFLISFKAELASVVGRTRIKAEVNDQGPQLQGLKILLVEDAIDNQELISHLLTRQGAVVTVADNGSTGVQSALEGSYDVVLMDIQMPVMDGYAAMEELKVHHYQHPVIALTAHAMQEERERTRNAGFSAHLTKPIQIRPLVESIGSVLRKSFDQASGLC